MMAEKGRSGRDMRNESIGMVTYGILRLDAVKLAWFLRCHCDCDNVALGLQIIYSPWLFFFERGVVANSFLYDVRNESIQIS